MKSISKLFIAAFVLSISYTGSVSATPLSLDYSISNAGGGLYQYDFSLVVDNNDGSWTAGDNFNWIIVGDCGPSCPSPLANWNWLSSSEPGFQLSISSGGHNGPTLIDTTPTVSEGGWYTFAIGDTLNFSGTSSAYLGQGEMLWSNLYRGAGDTSTLANFEVGNLTSVPEPATLILLSLGLLGLGSARSKKAQD